MAANKSMKPIATFPAVVTPKAPAIYAWLNKKDTMNDKYTITVGVPKDDVPPGRVDGGKKVLPGDEWIKYIQKIAKGCKAPYKIGEDGFHIKDGDKKDKDAYKGLYLIEAKSNHKPKIIDTAGKPVGDDVTVFSGDIVKVGIGLAHYRVNSKDYLTFYVNQVMLIEKKGRTDIEEWGDEEGYVASTTDEPLEFGDTDDDDDDF
jgi:hypothetical protein